MAGPARDVHTAAVVALLELGADPDRPDPSDGLTPLQAACTVGHTGAVRALLKAKVCAPLVGTHHARLRTNRDNNTPASTSSSISSTPASVASSMSWVVPPLASATLGFDTRTKSMDLRGS